MQLKIYFRRVVQGVKYYLRIPDMFKSQNYHTAKLLTIFFILSYFQKLFNEILSIFGK